MDTDSLWEKIKQGLRDGAATAAEKAEHLGKLGRARLDIARTRHAVHDAFTELGAQVYEQFKADAETIQRENVAIHLQAIGELEDRLQQQEAEFKVLQANDNTEAGEDNKDAT